jgi:TetR/AcrR family transcriptional regulator, tetracycline repressor protein
MAKRANGGSIRGTLSPEAIAASALALGDQQGSDAMTLRRIAAHLGCDPMALYRHFANRRALLDAVADMALAAVVVPDDRVPWATRLRDLLIGVRHAALAHPGIAPHIAARPPLGSHGLRIARGLLGALRDSGLSGHETVASIQVLIAYVSSSIAMAVETHGQRDDRWEDVVHAVGISSDNELPTGQMPAAGSAEQFAFGLEVLVDGLRTRVGSRADQH